MTRKTLVSIILFFCWISGKASVFDLPVQSIGGREYYVYRVQAKDGELAVCHKLEITRDQLLKYNPEVANGLKVDQLLYFPVEELKLQREVVDYKARQGDTLYGLSKKFKMSQDEFLALNPDAASGVKGGSVYKVMSDKMVKPAEKANTASAVEPKDENVSTPVQPAGVKTYVIADHESLYQIAHSHGLTLENLLALNPGLDATHYEAGQTINVPDAAAPASASDRLSDAFIKKGDKYTVQPGDTFYGISRKFGLTIEQIQNANPGLNILQEGMEIVIPQQCDERSDSLSVFKLGNGEIPRVIENAGDASSKSRLTVAVALPFMTTQKEPSKQARQYAEFYRGFMMGIDSMSRVGNPVTVVAFDTKASTEEINSILENPALGEAQIIIAPEEPDHLAMFYDYGQKRGINILNLFSVKDTAYVYNAQVMQANIPHDNMFSRAVEYELGMFPEFTPVFLLKKDSKEKKEYVDMLRAGIKAKGVDAIDVTYADELTADDLLGLNAGGKYAFIPMVSRQSELNKVLPALVELKERMTSSEPVRLLGYPEWITYRGKTLDNMQALDTYVYSRFYFTTSDPEADALDERYEFWYGSPMLAGLPRQGLLGFDVAMFLMRNLAMNEGDFDKYSGMYDGVQNPFHFRRYNGDESGWINDELYMINFRPSGVVDKLIL
ncbi:MAG: LysM peptidoglycan-binding domain-containing protein [Muribaculaceae bacterium]|nr:LysM peptidoglycan-binding domain-containing protein [Muribaculaceae bacterium]